MLITANYTIGDKVFSEKFISVAEFTEGIATLDLKNFKGVDLLGKEVTDLNAMNLDIDFNETSTNLKELFTNIATAQTNTMTTKPDALYVKPKLLPFTPKIKSDNNKSQNKIKEGQRKTTTENSANSNSPTSN